MFTINFFDGFYVTVEGENQISRELRQYYDHLCTEEQVQDPDLRVVEWDSKPSPNVLLGEPESYYGRDGDQFIIKQHNNHISIDNSWDTIRTSPDTSRYFISILIEFELRRQLSQNGFALVHASGIKLNGRVLIFPAWRHTGKTNTMLSLIQDGGGYLSDDRVWVHESGSVLGYPLPVNMLPYNFESFPDLLDISGIERVRSKIANYLDSRFTMERSIIDKIVIFITRYYIEAGLGKVVQLHELLPDCEFISEAQIDELVFLRTEKGADINIRDVNKQAAFTELTTTSDYEWNSTLREYCRSYDTLFDDGEKLDDLDHLINREEEIFKNVIEETEIRRLGLPREEDWLENEVTKRVRDTFGL